MRCLHGYWDESNPSARWSGRKAAGAALLLCTLPPQNPHLPPTPTPARLLAGGHPICPVHCPVPHQEAAHRRAHLPGQGRGAAGRGGRAWWGVAALRTPRSSTAVAAGSSGSGCVQPLLQCKEDAHACLQLRSRPAPLWWPTCPHTLCCRCPPATSPTSSPPSLTSTREQQGLWVFAPCLAAAMPPPVRACPPSRLCALWAAAVPVLHTHWCRPPSLVLPRRLLLQLAAAHRHPLPWLPLS